MSALTLDLRSVNLGAANVATYPSKAAAVEAHPTVPRADFARGYNRFWRFWVVITTYYGDSTFGLLGNDGGTVHVRPGVQPVGLRWSRITPEFLPGTTHPIAYHARCDCGAETSCADWDEVRQRAKFHLQEHERQAARLSA